MGCPRVGSPMITRRRRTASGSEREEGSACPSSRTSGVVHPVSPFSSGAPASSSNQAPSFALRGCVEDMSSRDRTGEFKAAAKLMQGRMGNGYVQQFGRGDRLQPGYGEFMRVARQIGKDIANTFSKLEKLALLAKRKTIFDDRPVEIEELTYIIKQDIGSLNKQIAQLQEVAKARNYRGAKHMQSHSNSVVVSLQSKLASMSSDFKSVLEVRTENLKHQKSRREQFSQSGGVSTGLPPSALSGHVGSVLLADEQAAATGAFGDCAIDMDGRSAHQQQMMLLEEQDSYLQSRADTMQSIESTIVELGSIFQQLAHMVKEQEEMVQRIDANVEDTSLNVEAAHSEILKYFRSVTSNRWLMVKVFAVLIVFFIIFVVFVA